jgi:hypothetical protein
MSFSVYEACIPSMIGFLENLSKILDKAVAQADAQKMPLSDLIEAGAAELSRYRNDLSRPSGAHRKNHRLSKKRPARKI